MAIALSYSGAGSWAIVAFSLLSAALGALLTMAVSGFKPSVEFDADYIGKSLRSLGHLASHNILSAAVMPILQYSAVIQLGPAAGGALQIAARLFTLIDAVAITPLRFLIMPLFARARDEGDRIATSLYLAVAGGTAIAAPAYFGLVAIAQSLLPLALGEANGSASARVVQLLSLQGPFAILLSMTTQALSGRGHLRIVFLRTALMYIAAVLPAVWAAQFSVEAMAGTYALASGSIGLALGIVIASRVLKASPNRLFISWARPFLAGATLLVMPLLRHLLHVPPGPLPLLAMLLIGPALYAAALWLLAKPELTKLLELLRSTARRRSSP